jgi:hypothetical protein
VFSKLKKCLSLPEFISFRRNCDVTRDVSENSSPVFNDRRRFVAQKIHQERQGSIHGTDVSLKKHIQKKELEK